MTSRNINVSHLSSILFIFQKTAKLRALRVARKINHAALTLLMLQVDGYASYNGTSAKLMNYMAHTRRKFIEAQRAQPKGKTGRADWAVSHIQKLYRIESPIKTLPEEERLATRQEKSQPLLNDFKVWLDKAALTTAPKTAIGKAIAYTLGQ